MEFVISYDLRAPDFGTPAREIYAATLDQCEWADDLGQKARARFRCRYRNGRYEVPSRTRIRDVLTRVDPVSLDRALQGWNAQYAATDEGLAIDGKTMCNAIDEEGRQTHILGAVGHQTQTCYTQKKLPPCP